MAKINNGPKKVDDNERLVANLGNEFSFYD